MKYFGIFLLLIFISPSLFAQKQSEYRYLLTTEQSAARDTVLKKLLITCEGTSGPRIFLGTLSEKLIKELENSNVAAAYLYTGAEDDESAERTKEALSRDAPEAVLKFKQADESGNPISVSQSVGASVLMGGVVMNRTTNLKQTFIVTLTSADAVKKMYWKATLKVNFNLTKSKEYNELVKMIMNALYDIHCFSEKPKK